MADRLHRRRVPPGGKGSHAIASAGAPDVPTSFLGRDWAELLYRHGSEAVHGTAMYLATVPDVQRLPVNLLSTMGNEVSLRLRRAVLLEVLAACEWNLAAAGERLGMGRRAAGVVRALKELGLGEYYNRLRQQGTIRHGGARRGPRAIVPRGPVEEPPKKKGQR